MNGGRVNPIAVLAAATLGGGPFAMAPRAIAEPWSAETNLSATATDSETGLGHRALERTPDGTFHVVWAERDTPHLTYRIRTRRFAAGAWTPSELVVDYLDTDPGDPGDDIGAKFPTLAATPDGTLHLFWHDYRVAGILNVEIFTKTRPVGGAWNPDRTADVRLTHTGHAEVPGDNGYVPVPVAAPSGDLHVLWYDFRWNVAAAEICAKTCPAGGGWDLAPGDSADVRVTTDAAQSELVDAASDAGGNLVAVWRSVDGGARVAWSRRAAATGTWTAPAFVDANATVAGAPCVAMDAGGRAHVVWPDSRDGGRALWTRVREASGAWGPERRLTRPADAADDPSLDASEDGTLHMVWDDARVSLFNREVFHRALAPGAAWDTTGAGDFRVSVSPGSSVRPSVRAAGGVVMVTWRDERDGNRELYGRWLVSGSTGAPGSPRSGPPALLAWPNPSRGPVHLRPSGARAPLRDVRIFSASGRLVRRLQGGTELLWDGRDGTGALAAPGTYYLRSDDGSAARVVVVR